MIIKHVGIKFKFYLLRFFIFYFTLPGENIQTSFYFFKNKNHPRNIDRKRLAVKIKKKNVARDQAIVSIPFLLWIRLPLN